MSLFDMFRKADKKKLAKSMSNDLETEEEIRENLEKIAEDYDKGEYYFQKGLQASSYKDYDGAIDNFTMSIEHSDDVSSVYVNRGAIYQIQERYLDARDDYIKALEIEKTNPSENYDEVTNGASLNLAVVSQFCLLNDQKGEAFRNQVRVDGIDHAAKRFGEVACGMMDDDYDAVYQYILEELEELDELGNEKLEFALNSGVGRDEYIGASKSNHRSPAHNNVYSFLKNVYCIFSRDPEVMFELRAKLIDQVMQTYGIGKYSY